MRINREMYGGFPLSVSQNYLTSAKTINRLLNIADITPDDDVIEIGFGKGHITKALLGRCSSLRAIEKDERLYYSVYRTLGGHANLQLINGDFLNMRLPARGSYKVFANIPFSLTTPIMDKLTGARNPPREAWLIMEKGAAKRFMGKPHETLRSLLLKPFFDIEIVYYFDRQAFHPMPSVDVVMVRVTKKAQPDISSSERETYAAFVRHSLSHGLYGANALLTRRQITVALKRSSLPAIETAGGILYIQWLCLFRFYAGTS